MLFALALVIVCGPPCALGAAAARQVESVEIDDYHGLPVWVGDVWAKDVQTLELKILDKGVLREPVVADNDRVIRVNAPGYEPGTAQEIGGVVGVVLYNHHVATEAVTLGAYLGAAAVLGAVAALMLSRRRQRGSP